MVACVAVPECAKETFCGGANKEPDRGLHGGSEGSGLLHAPQSAALALGRPKDTISFFASITQADRGEWVPRVRRGCACGHRGAAYRVSAARVRGGRARRRRPRLGRTLRDRGVRRHGGRGGEGRWEFRDGRRQRYAAVQNSAPGLAACSNDLLVTPSAHVLG